MAVSAGVSFGAHLRELRLAAGLTQQALAEAAQLSYRSISDLERGINLTPHKETMRLLASALHLTGAEREAFEAAARGRMRPGVPRQLPAAIAGFTGRAEELQALTDLLQEDARAGTVVISAVGGTAGIGKTALAVYWAHRVAERFSDGQLYVNLRGFDPDREPMTAEVAVRGFLDAFGVRQEQIPDGLDNQAALYRSLLAGRRVLAILDNAHDEAQVRPLLPGSPGCVVVVTSRRELTGLIKAEGAHPLVLDLLTDDDARALLARRIGEARVTAEPAAVEQIIESCARLPLALSIVAARAAAHPRFQLVTLSGELRDPRHGGLDAFGGGDQATDVRAVFSWSYRQLSVQAQPFFRLLGLHPGPDITPPAAASLAELPEGQARSALAELARAHLVTEYVPGRFAFHDLLRLYAKEQADRRDSNADKRAAERRMLDHYLNTAYTAASSLHPRWKPVPLRQEITPERSAGYAAAWAWFEAERPVLLAVIQLAARTGQAADAWKLSWTLMDYLDRRGYWEDLEAIQRTVLDAVQDRADRRQGEADTDEGLGLDAESARRREEGEAHAHEGLGIVYRWLHRYSEAEAHLEKALKLFGELGDQAGQADAHSGLTWMFEYQENLKAALGHAWEALTLYSAADRLDGQANALSDIAWCSTLLLDHRHALDLCAQALTLFRELGDRRGEAHTLDTLGHAHLGLSHHLVAISCYRQALALHKELGDRYHQAAALDHLGDAHRAVGDPSAARAAWQDALDILGHIPIYGPCPDYYPDAGKIRFKLGQLDSPNPDQQSSTAEHHSGTRSSD